MASVEQAERIGGFTLLGIPVLDSAIFALDNYARVELLVRLHDVLPSFLTNPIFVFVCLCLGIALLDRSYKQQMKRISSRHSVLVGVDSYRDEKAHGLLWPFLFVCGGIVIATPLLALAYSLAYKGTAPVVRLSPSSPTSICRTADCFPHPKPPIYSPPKQNCPNGGICIGGNNTGNASVTNNYGPTQRRLTETENQALATLDSPPLDLEVLANAGDKKAWNLGEDICKALRDGAHWRVAEHNCVEAMIPGEASSDFDLAVFLNPRDIEIMDMRNVRVHIEGVNPLVTTLRSFGLSVFVGPSEKVPKNFVKIVME
jgi:hypothetical protein